MLEDTEHAVTSDQAKTLLPLWQALQSGVTAEDEINAVLRGIEAAMTDDQLKAIADLQFTQEDMEAWVEQQGLEARGDFPVADVDPDALATRQAEFGDEGRGQMPPGGGVPSGEDVPPEMAERLAEFESMSEEEREAMMATARAGGMEGGFRGGAGDSGDVAAGRLGQARFLVRPLIELLSERAGVSGS